jgi:hypothetical protein
MSSDYVDTVFRDVFYKDTVFFITRDALGFQVDLYPLRTPFFHGDIVKILFKDSNIPDKSY